MSDILYKLLDKTFEWDEAKAMRNWSSHKVMFTEAATVYFDPQVMFFDDPDHSEDELRFIMVGHSRRDKQLFVVHVYRGDRIRIISARPVTSLERSDYESGLGR